MPRQLPDRDELHVWREFIETTDALRSRVTARLHDDTGLGPGDYAVLLALSEAPDTRLRSSELAAGIGWERSRLSHHLGRMERRGLITRTASPDDNRGALIVMSQDGGAAFRAATVPHLRTVRELFVDALTPEQLAAAGEIAAALRAHLATE
ncbi:DNA-binding MarR family transcriptional regulator [Catenuloplanes nepalensis]|uniref:DNA-binding MarR family transcriptional regulator n=1 Tax=Catenuloplanes nepalensis TaxID=587533 RepID=A0ABT9MSA4_9ACTN|nr:MarR family transcriptional regulator [Catenuloplanes nepalensis]MDP9793911.1 DNA-binding MarR family transcriptional regulator [Catenuloplanes nepalensis]